jgi:beta-glucosidase-like glycosyl hydrolase
MCVCSEDPYVNSQYAIGFISGMQWGDDPRYIKSSACAKHYAAYSLENWSPEPGVIPDTDRHHFNAIVTAQDEADTYLPAFQAAVEGARVSGIMCSYNEVNGIPSCANSFLLNEIARQEWGFYGYITSDWYVSVLPFLSFNSEGVCVL